MAYLTIFLAIIKAILEFALYIAAILALFKALKVMDIYINKNLK